MLAAVLLASLPVPKLAVIARFYHPYPDKRMSYPRLYTVDGNGRNRTLLSLPGQECETVMWAGRDRLVYEVATPGVLNKSSLWTVSLRDRKPRRLTEDGRLDKDAAFTSAKDGVPVIFTHRAGPLTLDRSGTLVAVNLVDNDWHDPFADDPSEGKTVWSRNKSYLASFTVYSDRRAALETPRGKKELDEVVWEGLHDFATDRFWVYASLGMHSAGIYRVGWRTGHFQQLFVYGYVLDWRPDRQLVAYNTPRDLSPYGPNKQVWSNELWYGDLESGVRRRVPLPIAWFVDVAVRPTS